MSLLLYVWPAGVAALVSVAMLLRCRSPRLRRRLAALLAVAWVSASASAALRLRQAQRNLASVAMLAMETPRTVAAAFDTRSGAAEATPSRLPEAGYVGSSACRGCHPSQYQSWHDSFHRTMTQWATPASVVADFDNVQLASRGRSYQLSRRGDAFWVQMVDPDWEHDLLARGVDASASPNPPLVSKRVVMTTGSHHQQAYWVPSERGRKLTALPFMWLTEDQRWTPREDVFLRPPSAGRSFDCWNNNCIECHAVAGEPNFDPASGHMESEAAELGIACEACHGPGREHIRANRDPLRRYTGHFAGAPDPTIVNPARLPAPASAQVCGQCHGMNLLRNKPFAEGLRYRPGGELRDVKIVLRGTADNLTEADQPDWTLQKRHVARETPTYMADRFWPDGMVRVSGREHNALIESACFRGGELSCLSCHSMHASRPDDQLGEGKDGDDACLQCHDGFRATLTSHTHHKLESAGSRCANCHMPHTTYGLLKTIRSHWIDSPSVRTSVETGRPNACNLCHLDRTLDWASQHLTEWYRQPPAALNDEQRSISAAVLWGVRGDANQRALIAWHMGWPPAQAASGESWLPAYLAHLLDDPYAAVRYIAQRSLRRLPAFSQLRYDYVGSAEHRRQAREQALTAWQHGQSNRDLSNPCVLINADGRLMMDIFTRLASQRDDRPMDLRE